MTYEELMAFALTHYEEGGDGVYECWDRRTYDEYTAEFGPIDEKKALQMFEQYESIVNEYKATEW